MDINGRCINPFKFKGPERISIWLHDECEWNEAIKAFKQKTPYIFKGMKWTITGYIFTYDCPETGNPAVEFEMVEFDENCPS